ncbi:hypothetical protein GTJ82_10575 [Escherichia coli]|nr:hypothetical protein [Escherichia coli]
MDYWLPIIVLFGAFFFMLALGVPIVYAIGLSTLASISTQLDFNSALRDPLIISPKRNHV